MRLPGQIPVAIVILAVTTRGTAQTPTPPAKPADPVHAWVGLKTASDLEPGSSKPAVDLVPDFMGRPQSIDAFTRWLDEELDSGPATAADLRRIAPPSMYN
jgi:hypothetical protein